MFTNWYIACAFVAAFAFQNGNGTGKTEIQLLFSRSYHGDAISAKTGEEWFGLFSTREGYALHSCRIVVEAVHDPFDARETDMTAKKVTVNGDPQPVFLVSGSEVFRDRDVNTLYFGRQRLTALHELSLDLDPQSAYVLSTSGDPVEGHESFANFKVMLSTGKTKQVVATIPYTDEDGPPLLLWAGDLDGDGKLDLLLDLTNHYNVSEPTLFLSSRAQQGKLLSKV